MSMKPSHFQGICVSPLTLFLYQLLWCINHIYIYHISKVFSPTQPDLQLWINMSIEKGPFEKERGLPSIVLKRFSLLAFFLRVSEFWYPSSVWTIGFYIPSSSHSTELLFVWPLGWLPLMLQQSSLFQEEFNKVNHMKLQKNLKSFSWFPMNLRPKNSTEEVFFYQPFEAHTLRMMSPRIANSIHRIRPQGPRTPIGWPGSITSTSNCKEAFKAPKFPCCFFGSAFCFWKKWWFNKYSICRIQLVRIRMPRITAESESKNS